ncbi:HesA/MoeB/ThiF family protein [Leptospira sp. 96542]|nr:HesA/MoeB/ThiF family protein [Leptospira sp. 96542]
MSHSYRMRSDEEKFFERQILVPDIGTLGQKILKNSSVLVIGLGGLGCPATLQLALSGVGKIGIMDFDSVELTNLHRQTLFTFADIGRLKTKVVSEALLARNPWVNIVEYSQMLSVDTDPDIFAEWDIVLDCTDTISSKYIINDLCLRLNKPFVIASVYRTSAQFVFFSPNGRPCYRCLFPNLQEGDLLSCNIGGVIGIQSTLAGTHQASLAVQYLLNPGQIDTDIVYYLEWNPPILFQTKMDINHSCEICGINKKLDLQLVIEKNEISVLQMKELTQSKRCLVIDVREEDEISENPIPFTISFPLSNLQSGQQLSFEGYQAIICICESGIRSKTALQYLGDNIEKYSLRGGRRLLVNTL